MTNVPPDLTNVVEVAAGGHYNFAAIAGGTGTAVVLVGFDQAQVGLARLLQPLVVADDHATRVADHVGDQVDLAAVQTIGDHCSGGTGPQDQ